MEDIKNATANTVAYADESPIGDGHSEIRGDHEAIDPVSGVKRGLKTRHLSMMALAGIVRQPC